MRAGARLVSVMLAAACMAGCRRANENDVPPRKSPLVDTELGQVRGVAEDEVEVFRGLPYAAPPVGELRFRPPAPAAPWTGIRDAKSFGPRCPQRGPMGLIGEEDCLSLNIWRPARIAAGPRPVLVFLHGGANVLGSGAESHYDGAQLALDEDLIVVTLNHRLGLLGFLAHPALTAESGGSGNWAYLDVIAALEWLQRNVPAFGGDPDRVTLVGHSAGALAACVLMASPRAAGLFDAAILHSGGCDVAPLAEREDEGEYLFDLAGCSGAADPGQCLRGLSVDKLIVIAPPMAPNLSDWVLPVGGAVDGVVLHESPWQVFAAGRHHVVPTIIGSNRDETELFAAPEYDCDAYVEAIREVFPERAELLLETYPCSSYASPRLAWIALTTDAMFTCQAERMLAALAPAAERANVPLFRYFYGYTRADPAVHRLRAFHGAELQLLFGTMDRFGFELPASEAELAKTIQRSWAGLARTGSPIHDGTPGWAPWQRERDNTLILDAPPSVRDDPDAARCQAWDSEPPRVSP